MRKPVTSSPLSCASPGITRRGFVRLATTLAVAAAGLGGGVALADPPTAEPPTGAWWSRAHVIAASGALGRVRWVEAHYPESARANDAAWAEHVAPILAAIGARTGQGRACAIGLTAPTVVLQIDGAPLVFLAPDTGQGTGSRVVLRGSDASLLVGGDGLWLRPEAPRAAPRRL